MNQLQAVKAEIERLKNWVEDNQLSNDFYDGAMGALLSLTSFIKSLEKEPEVDLDLEKEIDEKYRNDNDTLKNREQYARLARHFYELGLNARKEE